MKPLIITAALNGAETMREQNPSVPYTPVEIAEEALHCRDAGASMVHVHGRLSDGRPTQDRETFGQILQEIRARTDVLVQFSTGGAVGMSVEERIEALDLRPDMATLTTGTVNFGDDVFMNSLPTVRAIAERLREFGVRPEIEVFEVGMLETAMKLAKEGVLEEPLHVDFVLGVPGAMGGSAENLDFLVSRLPSTWTWCVAGIGRYEFPLAEQAIRLGGHVRVGLEDNVYVSKGVLAQGSWELVQRIVEFANDAGRTIATPDVASEILGIDRTK